jgi:hypothetical protein
MAPLIIQGCFDRHAGSHIAGAAVHALFLGDPPRDCGTGFDLVRAPAYTDDSGEFRLTFRDLGPAVAGSSPQMPHRAGGEAEGGGEAGGRFPLLGALEELPPHGNRHGFGHGRGLRSGGTTWSAHSH